MSKVVTSAGKASDSRKLEVEFDFGENLTDAIERFGEDVVFANYKRQASVGLQALIRSHLKQTTEVGEFAKTDEEIIAAIQSWTPSDGTVQRVDPSAKLEALLGKISEEDRVALLEKYL